MSAYQTFAYGNLFVVRYVAEEKSMPGGVTPSPRLFVVSYDEESDITNITPIEFKAAKALAPDQLHEIGKFLALKREEARKTTKA